jgi:hypothetical protein
MSYAPPVCRGRNDLFTLEGMQREIPLAWIQKVLDKELEGVTIAELIKEQKE